MQTKTIFAPIALGAALIASLAAAPAFAQPSSAPSLHISYSDLNLNSAKGAETMIRRIRVAAAEVCSAVPGSSGTSISAIDQFNTCYRATVAGAVEALGSTSVKQAYNRTGGNTVMASR